MEAIFTDGAGNAYTDGAGNAIVGDDGTVGTIILGGKGGMFVKTPLAGAGRLIANATVLPTNKATLNGTGGVAALANALEGANAILNGAGVLLGDSFVLKASTAALWFGTGGLTVNATVARPASAAFKGAGALAASAPVPGGSALLTGKGSMTANAQRLKAPVFTGPPGYSAESTGAYRTVRPWVRG
jgi:hypothetical protein